MAINLKLAVGRIAERFGKDPRVTVRVVLGVLLAANLITALVVFKPWGGSPEDLQRRLAGLRSDLARRGDAVEHLRKLVETVENTHGEADRFMSKYFLERATAYSTVLTELNQLAGEADIRPKGDSFVIEPIEGSESLAIMVITGSYEGTYADLVQFVNLLDRSSRFITIESLQATPQQAQGTLAVIVKLSIFVRGEGRPA